MHSTLGHKDECARHVPTISRRTFDPFDYRLAGSRIGYSGGATVAFDTALVLQQYGIRIKIIATLGGFVLRGKPGNDITETSIIGNLPGYVTGTGIAPTVRIIHLAGLQ